MKCCECNERPVIYIRHTQFAGTHHFCRKCAKKEPNFNEDDSYQWWEKIKGALAER